jgi:hypothetical protein
MFMKKILLFSVSVIISVSMLAQGNSGGKKDKDKKKDKDNTSQTDNKDNSKEKEDKDKAKNDEHDSKVWDGIGNKSCMKPSKNQPAKVREAFQRDYPNAVNVRWTKCRGDWTASFNGLIFRSTAVYHANGDRRDTRTPVERDNIPRKILDEILKRLPGVSIDGAIKIEVPNVVKEIFRIKNMIDGKAQYDYYDSDGVQTTYDY